MNNASVRSSSGSTKSQGRSFAILALSFVLVLSALLLVHAALISALLSLGFTDVAETLSINDPDVFEAQAYHYRNNGVDLAMAEVDFTATYQEQEAELQSQLNQAQPYFETSLAYWEKAISIRPLWPYYHLGALDAEVSLQDYAAIQKRVAHIIQLAPNERGLDKVFLIRTFVAWEAIAAPEKNWLLQRLSQVQYNTLKEVFSYAKQANNHSDICAHLPWKKVRKFCLN